VEIGFYLAEPDRVSLSLYDLHGREVLRVVDRQSCGRGVHRVCLAADASLRRALCSGTYVLALRGERLSAAVPFVAPGGVGR
jgi:hypothetical protein